MAKTWSADNPKAALMAEKRAALVAAAERIFLQTGYAESSVNKIAADAGVSIKTLYRHFDSKDDLFSAVMQAVCARDAPDRDEQAWFPLPPEDAFVRAGEVYLHHALSQEQLALYRVVTRDADRFPEVGKRYREEIVDRRNETFARYLDHWRGRRSWKIEDSRETADFFAGLLRAGLFEDALHGIRTPTDAEIHARAKKAAATMLVLLRAD